LKHFFRKYEGLCLAALLFLLQPISLKGQETVVRNDSVIIQENDKPLSSNLVKNTLPQDSGSVLNALQTQTKDKLVASYKPDPKKAVWYSALCPGLGQLYNRRYWKLPIIGAGVVGVIYSIRWNTKYYNAYTNAYRDIADDDPKTDSYMDLFPKGTVISNTSYLTTVLSNRQQKYRRWRDLSYVGAVGLYVVSLLDAFVDAQLYDFDISPDLSLTPVAGSHEFGGADAVGLSLAFRF
jgi:hypothetical protein